MIACVFTGPTLSAAEAGQELHAVFLPPVAQGDVIRVAAMRPRAIGIIDGYFERVPAVWHKEILWAMDQGIHVFGGASMGALRAAELAAFGMEGVGSIYEAFREGVLEDDDEVAVAHAGAEDAYRPASEAMVNIRATLTRAGAAGVVSTASAAAMERAAKALFYPLRTYPAMLAAALDAGVPPQEVSAFETWLAEGRADQKREDAIAMLRAMRRLLETDPPPKRVTFTFEHTEWWDRAQRYAGELITGANDTAEPILLDPVLDELRLDGTAYAEARAGALSRALGLEEARRQGMAVESAVARETADEFRRTHGLHESGSFDAWLKEQGLTPAQFHRLMEDEVLLGWVDRAMDPSIASHLPDHLRVTGQYARLLERVRHKQRMCESRGLLDPGVEDTGLSEADLLTWYFTERLGRPVPDDLEAYAREAGFAHTEALLRAVVLESCFLAFRYGPDAPAS